MPAESIIREFSKNEKIVHTHEGRLPITRNLAPIYTLSLTIATIIAVASVIGIVFRSTIYPTEELLLAFAPSDAFNLAVGLPMLLTSMWLARRGSLIALLCWLGALFYILYMYTPYLIAVPFNVLFLPYLILVALSAYTLIGLVSSIDSEATRDKLTDMVPERMSAGILLGLAALILLRQTTLVITAQSNKTPIEAVELAVVVADYLVAIPMLLVVGVQLLRKKALGYLAGVGLLLGYGALALSLIPSFVLQAWHTASPIDTGSVITVLMMALICGIPLVFFLRGTAQAEFPKPVIK